MDDGGKVRRQTVVEDGCSNGRPPPPPHMHAFLHLKNRLFNDTLYLVYEKEDKRNAIYLEHQIRRLGGV